MKDFKVKISVINPEYSPEYEKEWGFLERQYENLKHNSERVFGFDRSVREYRYKDDTSFELRYTIEGIQKNCLLQNVSVLEVVFDDDIVENFVISKPLISSTREIHREKYDSGYFYFYLLPDILYTRLTDTIYLENESLPEDFQ
jgi:hypothetical protein